MIPDRAAQFPISSELVMLNHASFGLVTRAVAALAERTRSDLELDSLALVDVEALVPRLRGAARTAAVRLGLDDGEFTLTHNATAGAAALMRSIRLSPGDQVAVLATEYASVLRGWEVRCEESGARLVRVAVPLPLTSTEQLLDAIGAQVRGAVAVAQLSLVSSSTAIAFPVDAVATWFRGRGALVALDAAHGPGHVALRPAAWGVDAMFGTLHKWIPTPRPVGFLWLDPALVDVVRPAEVSLTWDAPDLVERFAWPGTYDPTPRLCVAEALDEWERWQAAGDLERCAGLAAYASGELARIGGRPTSDAAFLPPRLRAVVLPGRARDEVVAAIGAAGIRGWAGIGPNGEATLRVATHVYNDEDDVDRLCAAVRSSR